MGAPEATLLSTVLTVPHPDSSLLRRAHAALGTLCIYVLLFGETCEKRPKSTAFSVVVVMVCSQVLGQELAIILPCVRTKPR